MVVAYGWFSLHFLSEGSWVNTHTHVLEIVAVVLKSTVECNSIHFLVCVCTVQLFAYQQVERSDPFPPIFSWSHLSLSSSKAAYDDYFLAQQKDFFGLFTTFCCFLFDEFALLAFFLTLERKKNRNACLLSCLWPICCLLLYYWAQKKVG